MFQSMKIQGGRAAGAALVLVLVVAGALVAGGWTNRPAPAGGVAAQATSAPILPTLPTALPEATATISASGTPTSTTFDPYTLLRVFDIIPPGSELVKETLGDLMPGEPREALLAINARVPQTTTAGVVLTPTLATLQVLHYDVTAGAWQVQWQVPPPGVPGVAVALPDMTGISDTAQPYQMGDLLRTGQPILLLRTQEAAAQPGLPPVVTLRLWAWTGATAVPLRMVPPGGTEGEAVFSGSIDVQTADLDDDGMIEILVDDGPTTTIYRWDAAARHFVVK